MTLAMDIAIKMTNNDDNYSDNLFHRLRILFLEAD